MSTEKNNGLNQKNSIDWEKIREIMITNNVNTSKSNHILIDNLVDSLFHQHFGSHFTHYDENIVCTKRRSGIKETSAIPPTDEDLWIFGYGSLVWKADFSYIDKKQGYIEGYQRRFFQHSIDHRGTHEKPGRVVTLVHSKDNCGRVYGVAYRIAKEEKDEVLSHLDFREKNGYERCSVRFNEFGTNNSFDIIMYIATNENESFAGGNEDDLQPIAEQIYKSAGPSGPNREYLFMLADAMRELFPGVEDDHLFKLEDMVKRLERRDNVVVELLKKKIHSILMNECIEAVISQFEELLQDCGKDGFLDDWFRKIEDAENS